MHIEFSSISFYPFGFSSLVLFPVLYSLTNERPTKEVEMQLYNYTRKPQLDADSQPVVHQNPWFDL